MFRELLGGEEGRKRALCARGAPKDQLGDDVRFESLERRGPVGDLFKDFTGLSVVELIREVWLMHEGIERDF